MLVRLLELSWWFYIHEKKQLHEVIDTPSETPNRHIWGCICVHLLCRLICMLQDLSLLSKQLFQPFICVLEVIKDLAFTVENISALSLSCLVS